MTSCNMEERVAEIDKAVDGLIALHRRLLACFQSPTGQARPRRPKMLEPTMADRDVALNAAVVLERIKATINSTPDSKCPQCGWLPGYHEDECPLTPDSNALREALGSIANMPDIRVAREETGFEMRDIARAALLSSDPGRVE